MLGKSSAGAAALPPAYYVDVFGIHFVRGHHVAHGGSLLTFIEGARNTEQQLLDFVVSRCLEDDWHHCGIFCLSGV